MLYLTISRENSPPEFFREKCINTTIRLNKFIGVYHGYCSIIQIYSSFSI